ncbi:hypothetical protein GCM10010405_50450 [Streptomyces macrosporus]|uniref:Uncharacterized protein n=1 Tax=Streptomyces macrosporus TaxID=44032 RepID=A0ABN3KL15_9ACTN
MSLPAPTISLRLGSRPLPRAATLNVGTHRPAHRGPLIGALLAHVPQPWNRGWGAPTALEHHDSEVRARFSDGTVETFDTVIGADGVHPAVRRMMFAPGSHSDCHNGVSHLWTNRDEEMETRDKAVIVGRTRKGLQGIPRRRVVERTFGRLVHHRRLARDDEAHPHRSEIMIHFAMIDLVRKRLTRASNPIRRTASHPLRALCRAPPTLPRCSRTAIRASFVSIMPLRIETM